MNGEKKRHEYNAVHAGDQRATRIAAMQESHANTYKLSAVHHASQNMNSELSPSMRPYSLP